MNKILKASFIAAFILLLGGETNQTYAQRCGGNLRYILRNKKGEIIDTEKVNLKFIRKIPIGGDPVAYTGDQISSGTLDSIRIEGPPLIEPDKGDDRVDSIKILLIHTYCGMHLVEAELEHESRIMFLRFHNIPPELNFFVDSVPFQEGRYGIDFKGDMKLKGQTLNSEGLRSKGGKYVLRPYARAGRLVAAKNWTRASSKRGRI